MLSALKMTVVCWAGGQGTPLGRLTPPVNKDSLEGAGSVETA